MLLGLGMPTLVQAREHLLAVYNEMLEKARQHLAAAHNQREREEFQQVVKRWEEIVERIKVEIERVREEGGE